MICLSSILLFYIITLQTDFKKFFSTQQCTLQQLLMLIIFTDLVGNCLADLTEQTSFADATIAEANILQPNRQSLVQTLAGEILFIDYNVCVRKIHNGYVTAVQVIGESF